MGYQGRHHIQSSFHHSTTVSHSSVALNSNGDPIKLPDNLESLPRAEHFPIQRHRWNTNEEIAAILVSFEQHSEWQSKEVKIRPKSGSMLLYSRKKVRYRRDGYCWKKRKDGKTTREDHMKLKVQGTECIYGCYVHSAILPTFHRRCYWLLQNPDMVLVHYLNVPYPDDNKLAVITPNLALWTDKKEWTKEELISQLKPMFFSQDEPDMNNDLEITTAETVEAIVTQLMDKQKIARHAALVNQLECGCPDSTCADTKSCSHVMKRIVVSKETSYCQLMKPNSRLSNNSDNNNQVSSTTGSGSTLMNNTLSRIYSRDARTQDSQSTINYTTTTPPLVLSLSQIQGGRGLLILKSNNRNCHNHQNAMNHISTVNISNVRYPTSIIRPRSVSQKKQTREQTSHSTKIDLKKVEPNETHKQTMYRRSITHDNSQSRDIHQSKNTQSTSKQLNINETGNLKRNSNCSIINEKSSVIKEIIFNETFNLTQEDIQRTLSANMPLCSNETDSQQPNSESNSSKELTKASCDQPKQDKINAIDFSDNCDIVATPTPIVDDVFANLDDLDMLGEFPELVENIESNHEELLDVNPSDKSHQEHLEPHKNNPLIGELARISDYSPDWAYPEGGVKVLVTGPWHSTKPYSILFDTFPVPTNLVQGGVLRCYCPAHEVGSATIQVACDGNVISNSVIFEYKSFPSGEKSIECNIKNSSDSLLKFTLLHRLEALDERLQMKQKSLNQIGDTSLLFQSNFEDRLVNFCQKMTSRIWKSDEDLSISWFSYHRGMKLLHLAASLGYSKLVSAMLRWRTENSSLLLETEIDALSQDDDGFTPLMWACLRGHTDTAILLYKWNRTALNVKNNNHQSAVDCAKSKNHLELVKQLEYLESNSDKTQILLQSIQSSIDTSLSPATISPASSVTSLTSTALEEILVEPRSEIRNENQSQIVKADTESDSYGRDFSTSNLLDLSTNTNFGNEEYLNKRSSIDSGIHMSYDLHTEKEITIGHTASKDTEADSESRNLSESLQSHSSPGKDGTSNKENNDNNKNENATKKEQNARVLTLAEQIIAAIPERIKIEDTDKKSITSNPPCENPTILGAVMKSSIDTSPSKLESTELNFQLSDNSYRYSDANTPCSSPASTTSLQSPCSQTADSPSPPPTAADFCEFFQASASFEKDFSNLALSDREQRELYEAAKIIQKAYRSYKGRQQQEQDKERAAAIVIQNYYRRYKQYAYYRQMTQAATIIQDRFRKHYEHKKIQKNQEAAACIQNYYRSYKKQGNTRKTRRSRTSTYNSKSI